MSQKTNPRIVIDTNKHGIRREINLDSLWKKTQKRKEWQNKPYKRKDKKNLQENTKTI